MKHEVLAQAMVTDQQPISIIENSETIEKEKLKEVTKALGVTVEAIKNFQKRACLIISTLLMTIVLCMVHSMQIIALSVHWIK